MSNFVDIHNHSLPGVDDGPSHIDGSIQNIKYLYDLGFSKIALTSHYIVDTKYNANVEQRERILTDLQKKLEEQGIKVELYLGNEVFINDASVLYNLLQFKEIATLNNSRYMLVEFPLHQSITYVDSIICALNEMGIVPILAHPERYSYYIDHFDKLKDLTEYQCYFQCNIDSILGKYGNNAKKMLKMLLKNDLVTVLATDTHHVSTHYPLDKAIKKIEKLIGPEKFLQLAKINPSLIIENKEIH